MVEGPECCSAASRSFCRSRPSSDIDGFRPLHKAACSPYTGEPYGIFVAVWQLVRDGPTSEEESGRYWELREWFESHLPVPPFHAAGNPDRAVTWFKEAALTEEMRDRLGFYFDLARKHGIEIATTRSASLGVVLYEDDFQVAVAGRAAEPG